VFEVSRVSLSCVIHWVLGSGLGDESVTGFRVWLGVFEVESDRPLDPLQVLRCYVLKRKGGEEGRRRRKKEEGGEWVRTRTTKNNNQKQQK
jgi:hypothetical protein